MADDGLGLPEGFDPAHSTGVGLTLVGLLAGQLGGGLSFRSKSGTKVSVSFTAA